jgi:hypothetical protein
VLYKKNFSFKQVGNWLIHSMVLLVLKIYRWNCDLVLKFSLLPAVKQFCVDLAGSGVACLLFNAAWITYSATLKIAFDGYATLTHIYACTAYPVHIPYSTFKGGWIERIFRSSSWTKQVILQLTSVLSSMIPQCNHLSTSKISSKPTSIINIISKPQ